MSKPKDFKYQLYELKNHSTVLSEACERFYRDGQLHEIINIGRSLRTLLCEGRGNKLLLRLSNKVGKSFKVLVLENYITIKITEYDAISEEVVQILERRILFDQPFVNQPTLPIISTNNKFKYFLKEVDFNEWLKNGFLLDWQTPNSSLEDRAIYRFTPIKLITCYANKDACHADENFAKEFGCSVEELKRIYIFNKRRIEIPIIYNYLYQIGKVTASLAFNFIGKLDNFDF